MAVLLVGLNLRPAMSSLSPLLETIRGDLGLSHAEIGLLTTIPVLCMGLFPILADRVAARLGTERALLCALGLIALGTGARLAGPSAALLFGTALAAGIGIGAAQTLVPAVVKRAFGSRGPAVMGLYAGVMTAGSGLAAGMTATLAQALGAWPPALAAWCLPALAALVLWAPAARSIRSSPGPSEPGLSLPWRSTTAWRISLFAAGASALFWSVLTWLAPAYRELGWSAPDSGLLLAVNATAQIATTLLVSALAGRSTDRRRWLGIGLAAAISGLAGVALVPTAAPWLWASVSGAAVGLLFPIALMLPLDFAADPGAVRRLAAMSLSVGYLLAALAPLLLGWLRGVTGSYQVPFLVLVVLCLAMLVEVGRLRPRA